MKELQFTQDWFYWAPELWKHLVAQLSERKEVLEIGSFEGRSAAWLIENLLVDGGWIDCIDTWEGGEEHKSGEISGAEERFDFNMEVLRERFPERRVTKFKNKSLLALAKLLVRHSAKGHYNFIYVDGSHTANDVLADACMAWPLLKSGGIMVFDDYLWGEARDVLHRPKLAVDAFVNINAEHLDILHAGYQLAVRKKEQTK